MLASGGSDVKAPNNMILLEDAKMTLTLLDTVGVNNMCMRFRKYNISSLSAGKWFMFYCLLLIFFKKKRNSITSKIKSEIPSECQTVWFQILVY